MLTAVGFKQDRPLSNLDKSYSTFIKLTRIAYRHNISTKFYNQSD